MGLFSWLLWGRGKGIKELARRLDIDPRELRRFQPQYRRFTIPKRSQGYREILAPNDATKKLQRRILRSLLARLKAHDAATGFERGHSIVTNAMPHRGQAAVVRFDLVDFFRSTTSRRVKQYFRRIGWNRRATRTLVRLCTYEGGLPQGAPTSPRLSNLVNYRLDTRLAGMATTLGAVYTRYADDLTFSLSDDLPTTSRSNRLFDLANRQATDATAVPGTMIDMLPAISQRVRYLKRFVRQVAADEGYRVHRRRKMSVRRRHHCQIVTGLVVNQRVNLPRKTRRWLRAVQHRTDRLQSNVFDPHAPADYSRRKQPTLTPSQLAGWRALQLMIDKQSQ